MKLKDLSFWGIFKLVLIFEYLVWILLGPILLILYIFKPEKFNMPKEFSVKLGGIKFYTDSLAQSLFMLPLVIVLGTLFFAVFHYLIFQKTPFGNIRIGEVTDTHSRTFD